jgi:hypothetical protein
MTEGQIWQKINISMFLGIGGSYDEMKPIHISILFNIPCGNTAS